MQDKLDQIIQIAKAAGDALMSYYQGDRPIETVTKPDGSPVTNADLTADQIIKTALVALDPTIPYLSEETNPIPFKIRQTWPRYWLVDPLDGTKQFLQRGRDFTINIALIEQHSPILGVIYAPCRVEGYFAVKGLGAYKGTALKTAERITTTQPASSPYRIIVSRQRHAEQLIALTKQFPAHELQKLNGALKFCKVAEGQADFYPRFAPCYEWDTAAGQCIVEQAGGGVVDFDKQQPLQYNEQDSLKSPQFITYGDPKWIIG